jgi:hypothetical protein
MSRVLPDTTSKCLPFLRCVAVFTRSSAAADTLIYLCLFVLDRLPTCSSQRAGRAVECAALPRYRTLSSFSPQSLRASSIVSSSRAPGTSSSSVSPSAIAYHLTPLFRRHHVPGATLEMGGAASIVAGVTLTIFASASGAYLRRSYRARKRGRGAGLGWQCIRREPAHLPSARLYLRPISCHPIVIVAVVARRMHICPYLSLHLPSSFFPSPS